MTDIAPLWTVLKDELDAWHDQGRKAAFWWRDDDAVGAGPVWSRLAGLQNKTGIPLAVAVIPQRLEHSLPAAMAAAGNIIALQHGHSHRNNGAAGEKKTEFPDARPVEDALADLRSGLGIMRQAFGCRFRPALVPPWNRITPALVPHLAGLGFAALSCFKARTALLAAPGLVQLNTHIDPVDWPGGDSLTGITKGLGEARNILAMMRLGQVPEQPIGVLTHHLHHDEATWDFLEQLFGWLQGHPAVSWVDFDTALGAGHHPSVTPPS